MLLSASIAAVYGQTTTEKLTNAKIISMVKGGLPKTVIIKSIENKSGNFDTSTEALLTLKKQGVPDDVITAIVSKGATTEPVKVQQTIQGTSSTTPSLDNLNQIYQYNKASNTVTALERVQADQKTKMKAFGYGGATVAYEVQGEKSPIRFPANDNISFIVNSGGNAPDFILYKLESKKKTRSAATMKTKGAFNGAFGSGGVMQGGNNSLAFNITQLKAGVYQITPSTKLESGEYFFANKSTAGTLTIEVYAFGID